ncbi:hypothetical protein KFE25_008355 [Diacronema lutheri]|uniref:Uncharacterized protein n=1 Tax=Diacronema lutheri TaxID=2081491 RepID=A0A8J5XDZ2_DIALT|nr:hypothetical protein KFE25_008355 [Diacronema lutheri]
MAEADHSVQLAQKRQLIDALASVDVIPVVAELVDALAASDAPACREGCRLLSYAAMMHGSALQPALPGAVAAAVRALAVADGEMRDDILRMLGSLAKHAADERAPALVLLVEPALRALRDAPPGGARHTAALLALHRVLTDAACVGVADARHALRELVGLELAAADAHGARPPVEAFLALLRCADVAGARLADDELRGCTRLALLALGGAPPPSATAQRAAAHALRAVADAAAARLADAEEDAARAREGADAVADARELVGARARLCVELGEWVLFELGSVRASRPAATPAVDPLAAPAEAFAELSAQAARRVAANDAPAHAARDADADAAAAAARAHSQRTADPDGELELLLTAWSPPRPRPAAGKPSRRGAGTRAGAPAGARRGLGFADEGALLAGWHSPVAAYAPRDAAAAAFAARRFPPRPASGAERAHAPAGRPAHGHARGAQPRARSAPHASPPPSAAARAAERVERAHAASEAVRAAARRDRATYARARRARLRAARADAEAGERAGEQGDGGDGGEWTLSALPGPDVEVFVSRRPRPPRTPDSARDAAGAAEAAERLPAHAPRPRAEGEAHHVLQLECARRAAEPSAGGAARPPAPASLWESAQAHAHAQAEAEAEAQAWTWERAGLNAQLRARQAGDETGVDLVTLEPPWPVGGAASVHPHGSAPALPAALREASALAGEARVPPSEHFAAPFTNELLARVTANAGVLRAEVKRAHVTPAAGGGTTGGANGGARAPPGRQLGAAATVSAARHGEDTRAAQAAPIVTDNVTVPFPSGADGPLALPSAGGRDAMRARVHAALRASSGAGAEGGASEAAQNATAVSAGLLGSVTQLVQIRADEIEAHEAARHKARVAELICEYEESVRELQRALREALERERREAERTISAQIEQLLATGVPAIRNALVS